MAAVQYAFYFNSANCTGCKTCQVACKECNHLPAENLYRRVTNYAGGTWEPTEAGFYAPNGQFGYFVSMSCNHCMNPACMENCPTGAIEKDADTGVVTIDKEVCTGCGTCITACPYGEPQLYEGESYAIKCDMCAKERELGRRPVCVTACPMRALDWGPYDELLEKYGEGDIEVEPLPEDITGAMTILNPHPKAQPTGQGTGSVVSLEQEL